MNESNNMLIEKTVASDCIQYASHSFYAKI